MKKFGTKSMRLYGAINHEWHHVSCVCRNGNMNVYIDGMKCTKSSKNMTAEFWVPSIDVNVSKKAKS